MYLKAGKLVIASPMLFMGRGNPESPGLLRNAARLALYIFTGEAFLA